MTKSYYYIDDYIFDNSKRHPRLLISDLSGRIIDNEPLKVLIDRLNNINSEIVDFRFHDYSTTILLACFYYLKLDFIKYLIENKNANVNYSVEKWTEEEGFGRAYNPNRPTYFPNKYTPLMSILQSKNCEKMDAVKLLIKHGANINSKDQDENTPLMYAIYFTDINIVNYLIEKGSDVNAVNLINNTPLMIAFDDDKYKIFRELIIKGCNLNKFLSIWNNVNKIINLGNESLKTHKHEMFYFARKYNEDKINFACNLFEKGIEDPLRKYMLENKFE